MAASTGRWPPLDDGVGGAGADYMVVVTDKAGVLDGYTQTFGTPDTNNNGQVNNYRVTLDGTASVD